MMADDNGDNPTLLHNRKGRADDRHQAVGLLNKSQQDHCELTATFVTLPSHGSRSISSDGFIQEGLSKRILPCFATKVPDITTTLHRARYLPSFWSKLCTKWDYQGDRKYFHVLENSYEFNEPFILPTFMKYLPVNWLCCGCCNVEGSINFCFRCGLCAWIPPNSCCTSNDGITKVYFDRGIYDRQLFLCHPMCGNDPFFSGPPTIYHGPTKYICCCVECPNLINEFIDRRPSCLCGETISVRPCVEVMGCKLEATWCCNCFGLCGVVDGEPICVQDIPGGSCLAEGEAIKLAEALNHAHAAWIERTKSGTNKL